MKEQTKNMNERAIERKKKYLACGRGEMISGKLAMCWQWVCNSVYCICLTIQQERERVSDRY